MARLYGILARGAETGLLFRRGPSSQCLLILWDLKAHSFTLGQWFKGQIYVHKCDLSPDGTKLVYFAAKHLGEMPTWIAVSSPPYLTAHVLWPGSGTWNEISLFETDESLALASSSVEPAPGFKLPSGLQVVSKPWPGHFFKVASHLRLIRDGWSILSGDPVYHPNGESGRVVYRKSVECSEAVALHFSAQTETDVAYTLRDDAGGEVDLQADWADVRGGEVFYAQAGKLFRRPFTKRGKMLADQAAVEIADFTDLTLTAVLPPDWAKQW